MFLSSASGLTGRPEHVAFFHSLFEQANRLHYSVSLFFMNAIVELTAGQSVVYIFRPKKVDSSNQQLTLAFVLVVTFIASQWSYSFCSFQCDLLQPWYFYVSFITCHNRFCDTLTCITLWRRRCDPQDISCTANFSAQVVRRAFVLFCAAVLELRTNAFMSLSIPRHSPSLILLVSVSTEGFDCIGI